MTAPVSLKQPTAGPCYLTRLERCPRTCKQNSFAFYRKKRCGAWGENKSRPVDVKVIAATNRNIEGEVEAGRFRRDLYYRLCVIELAVPPLRERTEDILPLARFFLDKIAKNMGRSMNGFSPGAAEHMLLYAWPGNVRELQNMVERTVALCANGVIQLDDLPRSLLKGVARPEEHDGIRPLAQIERSYILAALEMTNGNKKLAAEKLNIGLASLYRKLKKYEMEGNGS